MRILNGRDGGYSARVDFRMGLKESVLSNYRVGEQFSVWMEGELLIIP